MTAHCNRQRGRVVRAAAPEVLEELDRPPERRDDRPAAATAVEMTSHPAQLETLELLLEVARQLLRVPLAFR